MAAKMVGVGSAQTVTRLDGKAATLTGITVLEFDGDAREIRRFEGRQISKLPAFLFDDADRCKRINDGIVEGYSPDPEYEQTKFFIAPCAQDYWAALASGAADTIERERHLRMRFWRAGNDSRRRGRDALRLSLQERINLKALCQLCSEADDQQRLVKAEAMRELGNFGEALRLLDRPFPAREVAGVVATIRQRAERGDSAVALVPRGEQ